RDQRSTQTPTSFVLTGWQSSHIRLPGDESLVSALRRYGGSRNIPGPRRPVLVSGRVAPLVRGVPDVRRVADCPLIAGVVITEVGQLNASVPVAVRAAIPAAVGRVRRCLHVLVRCEARDRGHLI